MIINIVVIHSRFRLIKNIELYYVIIMCLLLKTFLLLNPCEMRECKMFGNTGILHFSLSDFAVKFVFSSEQCLWKSTKNNVLNLVLL